MQHISNTATGQSSSCCKTRSHTLVPSCSECFTGPHFKHKLKPLLLPNHTLYAKHFLLPSCKKHSEVQLHNIHNTTMNQVIYIMKVTVTCGRKTLTFTLFPGLEFFFLYFTTCSSTPPVSFCDFNVK